MFVCVLGEPHVFMFVCARSADHMCCMFVC